MRKPRRPLLPIPVRPRPFLPLRACARFPSPLRPAPCAPISPLVPPLAPHTLTWFALHHAASYPILMCAHHLDTDYMTDPEACAKKAGIHLGDDASIIHPPTEGGTVRVGGVAQPASSMPLIHCQICYESKIDYSALQCGHAFCNTCYTEYLSHKITDEGNDAVYARCPEEKVRGAPHESPRPHRQSIPTLAFAPPPPVPEGVRLPGHPPLDPRTRTLRPPLPAHALMRRGGPAQCRLLISTTLVASLLAGEADTAKRARFERASSLSRAPRPPPRAPPHRHTPSHPRHMPAAGVAPL